MYDKSLLKGAIDIHIHVGPEAFKVRKFNEYELARDIEEQDFPWDDDGVKQLQSWLQSRYDAYCAAHSA